MHIFYKIPLLHNKQMSKILIVPPQMYVKYFNGENYRKIFFLRFNYELIETNWKPAVAIWEKKNGYFLANSQD